MLLNRKIKNREVEKWHLSWAHNPEFGGSTPSLATMTDVEYNNKLKSVRAKVLLVLEYYFTNTTPSLAFQGITERPSLEKPAKKFTDEKE